MAAGRTDAVANPKPGTRGYLKWYWTKGPGLAKWRGAAHPWTTLRRHLVKHLAGKMSPEAIDRITSDWYREVFGHMPNQK